MPNFVVSNDGNEFLKMILDWEKLQHIMKEEDNRFVKTKMLVDGQDFIFFFICRGNIYGANENARSVFSIMKNPMDEPGYEEMSFSASNLSKAMQGEPKEEIFIYKDIDNIKVINKENARNILMKHKNIKKDNNIKITRKSSDGRIPLNKDFEKL